MDNLGKKFESQFKSDFQKTFPGSFIYRLPDQLSGYKFTSRNPCDFICYYKGKLFLIECKTHKGNTFPFSNFTQYDIMVDYMEYEGITSGLVLWLYEHDKVMFIPISEVRRMKLDGKKSINIKMLSENEYKIYEIPSIKKRTFMNSDYNILMEIKDDK